ncbi:beta-N-acetylglucosaminidase domain-containing protein [Haloactinopolyspora sp.]|uniref:beta-N-acetylglucosaminidase domain-containing protein n=1 Tax=Haloactinopolyspora sp. TaxID=1966353 RepID=UPI0026056F30|nr:beta-N-acetylglucosaminidase domain-containing protein [Haloactinopolyspora sp.]
MLPPTPSRVSARGTKAVAVALVALLVTALSSVAAPSGPAAAGGPDLPEIWPTPRSVQPFSESIRLTPVVALVAGDDVDPDALREVQSVLRSHDVRMIRRTPPGEMPDAPVTVWLGGPEENHAAAPALEALGVDGPEGLTEEGYVLAAGRDGDDRAHLVLAGVDRAGTYYAVQTLRQLVLDQPGRAVVPGVHVRDWPGFGLRGGMESFYGPVWSHADRLSQIEFLARHKMNAFFYGPADDVRTGTRWDAVYEGDELAALAEVVAAGERQHVEFIYRVSPSAPLAPQNGMCHSDPADLDALVARFEQLWDVGVRTYTIAWDDIPGLFQCEQDEQEFGDDPDPVAAAQAHATNYVQANFIDKHPAAEPLITVPMEYAGNAASPYRSRFDELLDPSIAIYWAGPDYYWSHIDVADLLETQQAFPRHELVIWDNYPVNDYTPNRLLLGPLVGREAGLEDHSLGYTANEMNQQEASLIPLFTIADFTWNPEAYDAERSWEASLREFGGAAFEALRTFAENSRSSTIDPGGESPVLKPLIDAFTQAYDGGEHIGASAAALRAELSAIQSAPAELRAELDNARFLEQAEGHLDKLELYGQGGQAAIDTLLAHQANDAPAAWRARLDLEKARAGAGAIPQMIAPGVVDPFLALAAGESDSWLGARWVTGIDEVTGGPPPVPGSAVADVADQDVTTAYRAERAAEGDESLTIALSRPRPLREVAVLQDPEAPAAGAVQVRAEDGTWSTIGELAGGYTEVDGGDVTATAIRIAWPGADDTSAPVVYEVIPRFADAMTGQLSVDQPPALMAPGTTTSVGVTLEGVGDDRLTGSVDVEVPDSWSAEPASQSFDLDSDGRTVRQAFETDVSVPPDAEPGTYPVRFVATTTDGRRATAATSLTVARPSGKPYRDLVLGDEPLGYWRLGELDGDVAADASGRAQDGTYEGQVELGEPGAIAGDTDSSARFGGGYVEIQDSGVISPEGAFTLETWVRHDGPGRDQGLIEKYDRPAFNGYALRLTSANTLQAWVLGDSGAVNVTGSAIVSPGEWHHVAAVYDGSTLTLYVDGLADGTVDAPISPGDGSGSLKLGARGDDAQNRLAGQLDEPAVYDRALTAEDVAWRYLGGRS